MVYPETGSRPARSRLGCDASGLLSLFPSPFFLAFSHSHPQTPCFWEALPRPRHLLSPGPPACLRLPSHHPELGFFAFMPVSLLDWELLEGCVSFSRAGPPSLLNEPQHPVSLSLLRASLRSCPHLPVIWSPGFVRKRSGGLAVILAHC